VRVTIKKDGCGSRRESRGTEWLHEHLRRYYSGYQGEEFFAISQ